MKNDLNCLSYWYPILQSTGVLTPKTQIIRTDLELDRMIDGKAPKGCGDFIEEVRVACDRFGYPCFLRTGVFSGKHSWKDTCFIPRRSLVGQHIYNLVEESALADMMGLPTDVWVVREFLDLDTHFTSFRGRMPINVERRFFIRDGKIQCCHPYWPHDAIRDQNPSDPNWSNALYEMNDVSIEHLYATVSRVAQNFEGYWSLDLARLKDGQWLAIDMAQGERSYHWAGCEHGGGE